MMSIDWAYLIRAIDECGPGQLISFFIALLGVGLLTIKYGQIPWVALSLALSSGIYSYAKKCTRLDARVAMGYETLIGTPAAFIYLMILQIKGTASFGTNLINTSITIYILTSRNADSKEKRLLQ